MNIATGTVYLVGAGPGDPELITVRGLRLLRQADVVVHDRLVPGELLESVRRDAEVINVGKAPGTHRFSQRWINALLVDRASAGRSVVRLKGGDPFVYGRGYEELGACRAAGVACVVVPGVSSAVAAPAAAGIPLTHRGSARSVAFITGQVNESNGGLGLDFKALAMMDTVVILMGRANLAQLSQSLIQAGRRPDTPVACIEQATTARQRIVTATLGTIARAADRKRLRAPVVTVIGEVARYAAGDGQAIRDVVQAAQAKSRAVPSTA